MSHAYTFKNRFLMGLVFLASSISMASTKVCYLRNDADRTFENDHFTARISRSAISILEADSQTASKDTEFNRVRDDVVEGHDGKSYLEYDWAGEEGCREILVDEDLLKKGTKGYIKFRCRGEGFGETKFLCRDVK